MCFLPGVLAADSLFFLFIMKVFSPVYCLSVMFYSGIVVNGYILMALVVDPIRFLIQEGLIPASMGRRI